MTTLEIQAAVHFREPLSAFHRQLETLNSELGSARLAFALGIHRNTLPAWRNGTKEPSTIARAAVRWLWKTSPYNRQQALKIEQFKHYKPVHGRRVNLSQVLAAQPDDYTPGGAIFDFWDGAGI